MCAANSSNFEITIFESDPDAREQIADNLTDDQIDQAVLTNLLHLDLSWKEKQAILSSCIRNPDLIETMAIERAKKIFKAEHANVQSHSGAMANLAAYKKPLMQKSSTNTN